jgi:gliding motility-associated transport system permease protein
MIRVIALKELKSLFLSPLAWSILAILQFILAFLFLTQVETFNALQGRLAALDNAPGVTDIVAVSLFADTAVILLLITPLLTMRLISEERRNKTLSLLLSAPISTYEIILGKYLGILSFFLLLTIMVALMPLSLLVGTELDTGKLFCNVIGLILLASALCAAGLYISALAEHPTVAAIASFGLFLLLWIIDWGSAANGHSSELFAYLSLLRHFQSLQSGLLDSADVLYFILFSATFIVLSIRRLEYDRLQQ